jgi:hypothetical protein
MSMPGLCSADVVVLSDVERVELTGWVRRPTTAQRMVVRARIVLAAADGMANAAIGRRLGMVDDTVRKWRHRFVVARVAGLADRSRSGRPKRFTDVQAAQIKALACELPATRGVPLSRNTRRPPTPSVEGARKPISRCRRFSWKCAQLSRWNSRKR